MAFLSVSCGWHIPSMQVLCLAIHSMLNSINRCDSALRWDNNQKFMAFFFTLDYSSCFWGTTISPLPGSRSDNSAWMSYWERRWRNFNINTSDHEVHADWSTLNFSFPSKQSHKEVWLALMPRERKTKCAASWTIGVKIQIFSINIMLNTSMFSRNYVSIQKPCIWTKFFQLHSHSFNC